MIRKDKKPSTIKFSTKYRSNDDEYWTTKTGKAWILATFSTFPLAIRYVRVLCVHNLSIPVHFLVKCRRSIYYIWMKMKFIEKQTETRHFALSVPSKDCFISIHIFFIYLFTLIVVAIPFEFSFIYFDYSDGQVNDRLDICVYIVGDWHVYISVNFISCMDGLRNLWNFFFCSPFYSQ